MNKLQKISIGITLIFMGIATFIYVALNIGEIYSSIHGFAHISIASFLIFLLGIVFIGGGFFILFSSKKR